MTSGSIFLLQALVVVALPVVLLRCSGLKGLIPLVVVQIVVGIALGPSIFGRIAPDYFRMFASPAVLSSLSGISSVAVLIFGLITGMHLDPNIFRRSERAFPAAAAANIVVPIALGCLAGFWILARHPEELLPGIGRAEFVVAIGICVSMKALPVLGAILGEMGLLGHRIGNLALGVAGISDMVLWILLGVLLTAVAGHVGAGYGLPPLLLLVLVPAYLLVMVRVVRPVLGSMVVARMRDEMIDTRALAIVGAATIASALATELMGLHYIFGAFVTGAVMPVGLRKPILDRLQVMTVALLMPFFFTSTGLRTLIDPGSPALFEVFVVSTAVAAVGIIGGTAVAVRFFGEPWPVALGLGSLLQAKGLTELIVLTVLLDAKIISPTIFSALILMAVFSTAIAMPLARFMFSWGGKRQLIAKPTA